MRILIRQFLSKLHSWSECGYGIARSFIEKGNEVDLFSTDGNCQVHMPKELRPHVIGYWEENKPFKTIGKNPNGKYDMQISYTAMKNFGHYLSNGDKNRFGIFAYEWDGPNILPTGFAKYHQACDQILAPSNFAKQVFLNSKVPDNKITVIPHGINSAAYQNPITHLNFGTKFKMLAVIGQIHRRKNLQGLLEAYGRAFTNKDEVILIIRTKPIKPKMPFELSFDDLFREFKQKYPNHAEIKIHMEFVENMAALYHAVDCVITMSHCEGFYFPGLEALAAGKFNIAPRYGGQLDFLNDNNSLLVEGKITTADPKSMYWESKRGSLWFVPDINDCVEKMRYAYQHKDELLKKAKEQQSSILQEYDWNNITNKIEKLIK